MIQEVSPDSEETLTTRVTPAMEQESDMYWSAKGSTLISGAGSFASASESGSTITTLTLATNAVFFFTKGFGMGLNLSLISASTEGLSSTQVAFGPKMLVVIGKKESSVYPYLGFGIGYISTSQSYTSTDYYYSSSTAKYSASGTIISFGAGMMIKIGEHLGLPVEFGMSITNVESQHMKTVMFGIGLAGLLY
jgi:hypothetical protein